MVQQLQKSSSREGFKRIVLRGVLYTVVIPLAVIAAIIGGIYLNSHIEAGNAQASMKEYLQKKYGQEFVVEKPEYKGGGLAVEGRFESVAYPRANNNLKFRVMSSSTGLWDNYASKVWENQRATEAKPIIDEILKDIPHAYNVEMDSSHEISRSVGYPLPSLEEAIDRYGDSILYTLTVHSKASDNVINYDKAEVLAKLMRKTNTSLRLVYKWSGDDGDHIISMGKDDINKIINEEIPVKQFDKVYRR